MSALRIESNRPQIRLISSRLNYINKKLQALSLSADAKQWTVESLSCVAIDKKILCCGLVDAHFVMSAVKERIDVFIDSNALEIYAIPVVHRGRARENLTVNGGCKTKLCKRYKHTHKWHEKSTTNPVRRPNVYADCRSRSCEEFFYEKFLRVESFFRFMIHISTWISCCCGLAC